MERNTYIYLITHIDNDPYKVYIGKTINIHSRKLKHYKSFGKNILFNIIDESLSLRKYWEPLESYWIEQFKQWGFDVINKNKGGGGIEYRSEENLRLIISKISKPIIQYTLNGEFVKEWKSIKEAEDFYKVTNIGLCVRNKNKKAAGFIWKKKGDTNFNYNFSTHKSKNTKKPKGFGKKPEGFGDRISQSLLLFYKEH